MPDDDRVSARDKATEALELAKSIHPLLAGRDPDVVGAALCDLLGTFLAGHPKGARGLLLLNHMTQAAVMMEIEAQRLGTD